MSFIHYLFLGHFEHDGETIRFSKNPGELVFKPVVHRPIDSEVIKAVFQELEGDKLNGLTFPEDWMIWREDGYLVCDKYTRNAEAINFVARLVERTRCDIYDVAARCAITLCEWLAVSHSLTRP